MAAAGAAPAEPPLYVSGEYAQAADGWWAHRAGQWLYNPEDKAYFHLPTGQLHLAPAEGLLVKFSADAQDAPAEGAAAGAQRQGTVRWYNARKGFGFIAPQGDSGAEAADVFFHRKQIDSAAEEKQMTVGVRVTFAIGETDEGRDCAVAVRLADRDAAQESPAKRRKTGEAGGEDQEGGGESDAESGSSVEIDVEHELKSGISREKGPSKDRCEDFAVDKAKLPIGVLGEAATCVFFAVFDGHGGMSCAEYATAHLAKNILSRLRDRPKGVSDEVFLKGGLIGGFKQTEHNFLQHARRAEDRSGCTACTMTVFGPDEEMRLRLFFANLGDSRAVLGKTTGEAVRLTTDHKPNLPEEKRRIEAAGGGVAEMSGIWRCLLPRNRISPILGLAVSRAFGDKDFKGPDIVSAEPEVSVHEVDWDGDDFVILASDGIWDVISDRDAVRLVQQVLSEGGSEAKAAQALTSRALERGTADDRTALVVRFGWCRNTSYRPPPEPVAEAAAASAPQAEEEEEENDPEVLAAIRAAMGLDDGDDESMEGEEEEEEAMAGDAEAPLAQASGATAAAAAEPSAAAAIGPAIGPPPPPAVAEAASSGAGGKSTDAPAEAAATTAAPPAAAGGDDDDIFALLGGDDQDAGGDAVPAPATAPGGRPVGMGLFDLELPAPAEEQGPALVGPRRPGEA